MGEYRADEQAIKRVLVQAILKLSRDNEWELNLRKQQVDVLLDRLNHGLPALPLDAIEDAKKELEKAIRKAEWEGHEIFLLFSSLAKTFTDGSLQEVAEVIEREQGRKKIRKGLECLAVEFRVKHSGFEDRMLQPGFMDQLYQDFEKWQLREPEYTAAIYRLDIQAADKWLAGEYRPEVAPVDQGGEPGEDRRRLRTGVPGGFIGFCLDQIKALPPDDRARFLAVNSGDSTYYNYREKWKNEWVESGNKAYKNPAEGISKAKAAYRKLNKELKS